MLNISVLTPEKKLFEGIATLVEVPGTKGRFQILENHAPIVSDLTHGSIRIVQENQQETLFDINTGIIECTDNQIIVLIES
jgi:F-type H+-transporting ATPase subunit epsilon